MIKIYLTTFQVSNNIDIYSYRVYQDYNKANVSANIHT